MNLAETASTLAEAVVGEERLATAESDQQRICILDALLSDSVSFLMNSHTSRFVFEDQFHLERADQWLAQSKRRSRLSELMLAAQKEAYLNSLSDDGWNPTFWISKLHFYISGWPFYNFPYAFGYLLSLGLYALGRDDGDAFPAKYRELLVATGRMNTEDAVQSTFGYDLTTSEFWNKSLDVVEQRVDQFLSLVR